MARSWARRQRLPPCRRWELANSKPCYATWAMNSTCDAGDLLVGQFALDLRRLVGLLGLARGIGRGIGRGLRVVPGRVLVHHESDLLEEKEGTRDSVIESIKTASEISP